MPPENDCGGGTVTIVSGDLQLRFVRSGDRFSHHIAHLADKDKPLLASVEGLPDDPWPVSPPWQELHVERRGDVEVALLVGRAGRSHWSMSVEPSTAGRFSFDVACRTAGKVGFLGSTYRLRDAALPVVVGKAIHVGGGYELDPLTGEIESSVAGQNRIVRITPIPGEHGSPRTIRWQYRLSL